MDSSSVSSDTSTPVFCSPDGSVELSKTETFRTSVSVSSLAEKFEKSGGESIKCEDAAVNGSVSDINGTDSEHSVETKDCKSYLQEESKGNLQSIHTSESSSKGSETDQSTCKESGVQSEPNPLNSEDCSISAVQELKNNSDSLVLQSSTSAGIANEEQEKDNSYKVVEERVAYFVEKISKASQMCAETDISPKNKSSTIAPKSDAPNQLSLKDLEKSFVSALNLTNEGETDKAADTLLVPSIEITAASDREDTSSEDSTESKQKSEINKTENKSSVEEMEVSDTNTNEETTEPTPSTSTAIQGEKNDESEVSAEESRAFFYISSEELPAGLVNDTLESSDDLRQRFTSQQGRTEPVSTRYPERGSPSCLCSKNVHGATFLFSFVVAIFGFILYGLANRGKVPPFCQYLGLVTAVIAGTVGAFSCFCFTFLEAFPRLVIPGYERLLNTENAPVSDRNTNTQAQNLDDESWSSEKERAFRRQNGMSSTRTSAGSLRRAPSDQQQLLEKAEKLKKEVVGLLDSFTQMIKLESSDEASEMESGTANEQV